MSVVALVAAATIATPAMAGLHNHPFLVERSKATPKPRATATATPTPDPTATPTATATSTPDPTATPTATATPTPDPTPTATATPTPDPTPTPLPGFAPVTSFGAVADHRQFTDAACAAGSNIITTSTGHCTSADVGKVLAITNAGGPETSYVTTVAACNGSNFVGGSGNCSQTVSNQVGDVGTDNGPAFQAAFNAGNVQINQSGNNSYLIATTVDVPSNTMIVCDETGAAASPEIYNPKAAVNGADTNGTTFLYDGTSHTSFTGCQMAQSDVHGTFPVTGTNWDFMFYLADASDNTFDGIKFVNQRSESPLELNTWGGAGSNNNTSRNLIFQNCGLYGESVVVGSGNTFTNVTDTDCFPDIEPNTSAEAALTHDNTWTGSSWTAITRNYSGPGGTGYSDQYGYHAESFFGAGGNASACSDSCLNNTFGAAGQSSTLSGPAVVFCLPYQSNEPVTEVSNGSGTPLILGCSNF